MDDKPYPKIKRHHRLILAFIHRTGTYDIWSPRDRDDPTALNPNSFTLRRLYAGGLLSWWIGRTKVDGVEKVMGVGYQVTEAGLAEAGKL